MVKKNKERKVKEKKPREKMTKRQVVNTVCIIFLSAFLIVSVVAFTLVQSILSSSNVAEGINGLSSENSTTIYDRNGEIITTLSSQSGVRENVDYEDIPQVVIDAFLAVEDSRFFKHSGFDLPRFVKSGLVNVSSGGIVQGGSTLTMQLVDVALFPDEETVNYGIKEKIEQKVVEIFKSMEIESKLTKEQIIENYLNKINFGGPARGIQKGAQYYFGKDVQNLTLSEAAYLAGVVNAPGSYNAYTGNYEYAVERRNKTLYLMNYHGYISDEEYQLAKSCDLSFQLNGVTNFATEKYQSFVDAVIAEAKEVTGKNPYTTPMKIYTTMDKEAQEQADALCDGEGVDYPDELFQTGFTAINNQTGEVLAIGGGRSYSGDSRNNRGYIANHQFGSTAKPIVDYAPAFEYLGYSTEMVIEDGPIDNYTADGGTLYNADRKFRGDVTLKEAIGLSLNIPAYKTLKAVIDEIGIKKEVELLNSMGITSIDESNFAYGAAIGGSTLDGTPLQLAGAYQVFANKGYYQEPYTIEKIEFQDDSDETYEHESEKVKVFSEETAYLMSYMLKDAVENSSYQTLVNTLQSAYTVYGKSGTTDYGEEAAQYGIPEGASKDKWMVGYTDTYTVACWAGYDEPIAGKDTWLDDTKLWANVEGTVVKTMLDNLTNGEEVGQIQQPSGVVSIQHIQGLFPYATSSDGGSASMVTALINKKFSKLESVSPDELDNLSSFDVNLSNNVLTLNFSTYSDASKLVKAEATKTMSGGGVTTTGKRIFDKSFLYGAVQYKYDVYVNDKLVSSNGGSNSKQTVQISSTDGDTVKVCGYYGYENASTKSNQICKSITSSVETTYKVGTDFDALFTNTTTYDAAKNAVENYVATYLPGVNVTISSSSSTSAGKYDSSSTLKSGMSVKSGESYTVVIGTK